jgi:hypothetical protein
VILYPVIAVPPSLVGAVMDMVAEPEVLLETLTATGTPGSVAGVTAIDAVDKSEVKDALLAVALNVYAAPLVKPVQV